MTAPRDRNTDPWTIGRLLKWTTDHLERHGVPDARLAAEVLLAHAARSRRIDLYARFEQTLEAEVLDCFRAWVQRAAAREPVAYLVGEKEFFSLPFHVTSDVLIPRVETEVLVECVIDHCAKVGLARARLLELGTGSGCVVVSLLRHLGNAVAVATDRSTAALAIARSNAVRHGVLDRLTLVEADCLALPPAVVPEGGFDVLASNPPYVPVDAVADLDVSVRDYEPAMALTDGGDGLSFYRCLSSGAQSLLAPDGVVFVEIDDGRARAVKETMTQGDSLVHRRTWKDQVVGAERVLMFSRANT